MKRRKPIRREGQAPRQDNRVRRVFVDPSKMKASELKALVCLFLNDAPAPFLTGHAFCRVVNHPSIDPPDSIIPWKIVNELVKQKLAGMDRNFNVFLTGAGKGIGRSLSVKPILGYD